MKAKEFRQALHAGQRVYGTAVSANTSLYFHELKSVGLDWVFIDNEQTPIGREATAWMCRAYDAAGIVPAVRVPGPEPWLVNMAIADGARAVIVPYVEDVDVVRELVGAVKLRPLQGHKLRSLLGEPDPLSAAGEYVRAYNEQSSLIIQVESQPGLDHIDELCSVSGLDGVLIGPHDLSVSLGVPEDYEHPEFLAAVKRIIASARAHGVGGGIHHAADLARAIALVEETGANLIAHRDDASFVGEAVSRDIGALRDAFGDLCS